MSIPLLGSMTVRPNKIQFMIQEIELLPVPTICYPTIPIEFAKVKVLFQIPCVGDVERDLLLFMEMRDGSYKIKIGNVYVSEFSGMYAEITRILWRSEKIREAFGAVVDQADLTGVL